MANKRKSKKSDNQSQGSESALLDMSDRDVKKMIKAAKSQGFVTYEQLNKVTSAESLSSEQITIVFDPQMFDCPSLEYTALQLNV